MKTSLLLATIVSLATLVGCASGPKYSAYSGTLPPLKDGNTRLWFYRPVIIFGSGVQPRVFVNKVSVGKAVEGGCFYADEPAGRLEIQCGKQRTDRVYFTAAPNQEQFVRLNLLPGVMMGHVMPEPVSKEQGIKDIQSCSFIGEKRLNKNSGVPLESDEGKK